MSSSSGSCENGGQRGTAAYVQARAAELDAGVADVDDGTTDTGKHKLRHLVDSYVCNNCVSQRCWNCEVPVCHRRHFVTRGGWRRRGNARLSGCS